MTSQELMQLSPEAALAELSWESIEWLFQPVTMLDLLLRLDCQGMKEKIIAWCADDPQNAKPFRRFHTAELLAAVRREQFYRAVLRANPQAPDGKD